MWCVVIGGRGMYAFGCILLQSFLFVARVENANE